MHHMLLRHYEPVLFRPLWYGMAFAVPVAEDAPQPIRTLSKVFVHLTQYFDQEMNGLYTSPVSAARLFSRLFASFKYILALDAITNAVPPKTSMRMNARR